MIAILTAEISWNLRPAKGMIPRIYIYIYVYLLWLLLYSYYIAIIILISVMSWCEVIVINPDLMAIS